MSADAETGAADGADDGAAFRVTLGCENCGDEWVRTFPTRTKVERHGGRVLHADKDHDVMLNQCSDGCCGWFWCPTCELSEHVTVTDREPLDGDDAGGSA